MKKSFAPLTYDNITLTLLTEDDLNETLSWRNANSKWFNDAKPIEISNHYKWFESYLEKENDFVFIIRNQFINKVGQVAIYNINWEKKEGEFGRFLVNSAFTGQNYMKKSCFALLQLAQNDLDLTRIYLEVKPDNQRAIHIYKNAGFSEEGYIKNGNLLMAKFLGEKV